MSVSTGSLLEKLLRTNDLGWMIDWFSPPDQAIGFLKSFLEKVDQEAHAKFGNNAPRFTEAALEKEFAQNPHKVKAFLQALGATRSSQMLLMVWRILQGKRIQRTQLTYQEEKEFRLEVVLSSPENKTEERYVSTDIGDAALLRHFGIMRVDNKPVFDGFYPL
jgi:hypothetical protein